MTGQVVQTWPVVRLKVSFASVLSRKYHQPMDHNLTARATNSKHKFANPCAAPSRRAGFGASIVRGQASDPVSQGRKSPWLHFIVSSLGEFRLGYLFQPVACPA